MAENETKETTKDSGSPFGKPRKFEGTLIRFLVSQPPYNAGETAGFPPEIADRYLAARTKGGQKIAERADKPVYLKSNNPDEQQARQAQ